ncbi:MAG: hypothetical protein V1755_11645 [Chloroflexota bacterium]
MPAKKAAKAAPASAPASGMNTVWMWVYAVGMVVAGLAGGLGFSNNILNLVLLLAAVLVGLFYFDPDEVGQFGLRVLVLYFAKEGLGLVPGVGGFITGFFGGWVFFLFPVVLAMALRFFWSRRIAPLF